MLPLSFAQWDQTTPVSNPEIEILKKRISELQNQLQTVKNEKLEIVAKLLDAQAKLADANAKLANVEFGKFERELRNSNDEWLRNWSLLLIAILSAIGAALWFWFKSITNQLIADEVKKNLNGFKEAVAQVDVLKDQIRILEKEHAVSVLANSVHLFYSSEIDSEQIEPIPDRALLDLLADKTRDLNFRYKAVEILVDRKPAALVFPALEFLNSVIGSDLNWKAGWFVESRLSSLVNFLGHIHTQEVHEGLKKILDCLLSTEDQMLKHVLLSRTTFSLARVSGELNRKDSVSLLKTAIPALEVESHENQDLIDLLQHFDKFNEPEGIKKILTHHAANGMPDVENSCLRLLQKHDPEFVEKWRAEKETTNTENEESV